MAFLKRWPDQAIRWSISHEDVSLARHSGKMLHDLGIKDATAAINIIDSECWREDVKAVFRSGILALTAFSTHSIP